MTLSNALPVQFWPEGEESFNEKQVCGVEPVCWCQPWNCDDVINLQFHDPEDREFLLNVIDADSNDVLDSIPFTRQLVNPVDYLGPFPLSGFYNDPSTTGTNWTTGATPSATLTTLASSTKNLVTDLIGIPPGRYTFQFTYASSGSVSVLLTVRFRKNGSVISTFNTSPSTSGGTRTVITVFSVAPDQLEFDLLSLGNGSRTITITSISMVPASYIHSVSTSVYDYCGRKIKLQIATDASPSESQFTSDCLAIKTNHSCTELITYSNSKDFTGIAYQDLSPPQQFSIRLPAVFFHTDNPAEQEDTELSDGTIVRLYNKLERRRLLDLSFLPDYMHEKVQLILMHDNVTIDGRQWIRRDAYNKSEGNNRFPLKRASVWLHDKNFIKENQL